MYVFFPSLAKLQEKIGWIFIDMHLAEWQILAINFVPINLLFPGFCSLLS